ncbi:hypothetical protein GBW32_21050 [Streptomyces tsukubensis]|uniref:SAM-dependent methyltransferase n=1 Tax=Streptomyces tsukubensis TaxID=83656 RepID=A0A1V4A506_9ACTN|nr:hypothetical protein B1H18_22735 [Streptomyces tsukubensis]QFR95057.1 hypothetical protein GBW32_21050 [Streptomyces tsukubensis]
MTSEWQGWREAAGEALYGASGFYLAPDGPGAHFRTSVHASPLFAAAVARLLRRVDAALGHPDELTFVDLGAGHGELVTGVLDALPAPVAARVLPYAVEHAPRPAGLDPRVTWTGAPPTGVTGLLFANEWLDNIPLDVVESDEEGVVRTVLVRRDGEQRLGAPVGGTDAEWLRRWWPLPPPLSLDGTAEPGLRAEPGLPAETELRAEPGLRAETGLPRDEAWEAAVGTLTRGLAVAVDYAHTREARPPHATLTGYLAGRQVPPVPDGSRDITAHVALDACAARHPASRLLSQRAALRALGVDGGRPPLTMASTDPAGYVRRLASAGEAAELTATGGLGDFGWLLTPVGVELHEGTGLPGGTGLHQDPGMPGGGSTEQRRDTEVSGDTGGDGERPGDTKGSGDRPGDTKGSGDRPRDMDGDRALSGGTGPSSAPLLVDVADDEEE